MRIVFILIGMLSLISVAYAEDKLDAITTMNEFSYLTHTYYLHPQPELIDSAIAFVSSSGIATRPNAKAPLLMSFSCLFSMYDSTQKEKWIKTIKGTDEPAKLLLTKSINQKPSDFLNNMPLSAAKNDMHWACFFATGDYKYLNEIIFALKHLDNRKDIDLFLTAASAKWSLSSNAKNHFKVKMAMEAMKIGDVQEMRPIAEDILNKDPQQIKEETVAIVKEQKQKGVW